MVGNSSDNNTTHGGSGGHSGVCADGDEGCACYGNLTCNGALTCAVASDLCVNLGPAEFIFPVCTLIFIMSVCSVQTPKVKLCGTGEASPPDTGKDLAVHVLAFWSWVPLTLNILLLVLGLFLILLVLILLALIASAFLSRQKRKDLREYLLRRWTRLV